MTKAKGGSFEGRKYGMGLKVLRQKEEMVFAKLVHHAPDFAYLNRHVGCSDSRYRHMAHAGGRFKRQEVGECAAVWRELFACV